MPDEMAFVGIGANLGHARGQVLRAIDELACLPYTTLLKRSSLYRSAPVEASGPDYVNAVVKLRTGLPAVQLLLAMHAIEDRFGRSRPSHHAPRTLDLDLLLYGRLQHDESALHLPHPRLHKRAFVLQPLLEIEPLLEAPGLGPLAAWLDATRDQVVTRMES